MILQEEKNYDKEKRIISWEEKSNNFMSKKI